MFKKKVWVGRVLAICLSTTLVMPMTTYAAEANPEVYAEQADEATESDQTGNTEAPGEPEQTDDTENPVEPEDTKDTEKPDETETGEAKTPTESETGETKTPAESETEKTEAPAEAEETETPVESTAQETETPQEQTVGFGSNTSLLDSLKLVIPPLIEDSFRFITIEKVYAIVQSDDVNVYDSYVDSDGQDDTSGIDESEEPIIVGTLQKDNLCYIIEEFEGSDWIYVESGVVRGFVKAEYLLTGEGADTLVEEKGEENFIFAEALVEPINNEALTYTKTTTQETVIDKVYAIATVKEEDVESEDVKSEDIESDDTKTDDTETLNIYEGKDTESRIVGELPVGALSYIIADAEEDWIFIESNDVRGFVEKDNLIQGNEADAIVTEAGEDNLPLATEIIPIEENKACYYTLTSIKEGVGGSAIRTSMLEFAQQFLGNPYVWGGTSLTNGTDCSGFVQGIYAHYGYSLPRVAEDQARYGMQIPLESAAPGDLIFYAKDGYVYHVVMYMGDGKVIHASSSRTGIIISDIDTAHAVWATRVIDDSDTPNIQVKTAMSSVQAYSAATSADVGEYLGEFKLTAYCACEICCGQWADGITASGTIATEGRTIAMAGVPLGTKLVVNGVIFTVEDRGTPYGHIDIFMNEHDRCLQFGVGSAKVYMAK